MFSDGEWRNELSGRGEIPDWPRKEIFLQE
jgi:hypothetical protein